MNWSNLFIFFWSFLMICESSVTSLWAWSSNSYDWHIVNLFKGAFYILISLYFFENFICILACSNMFWSLPLSVTAQFTMFKWTLSLSRLSISVNRLSSEPNGSSVFSYLWIISDNTLPVLISLLYSDANSYKFRICLKLFSSCFGGF